jgi:hypothetical protein
MEHNRSMPDGTTQPYDRRHGRFGAPCLKTNHRKEGLNETSQPTIRMLACAHMPLRHPEKISDVTLGWF